MLASSLGSTSSDVTFGRIFGSLIELSIMKKLTFEGLGTLVVRRRKATLVLFIIATLVFGGIGSAVFAKLKNGGYSDPSSDSYKAYKYLSDNLNVKEEISSMEDIFKLQKMYELKTEEEMIKQNLKKMGYIS